MKNRDRRGRPAFWGHETSVRNRVADPGVVRGRGDQAPRRAEPAREVPVRDVGRRPDVERHRAWPRRSDRLRLARGRARDRRDLAARVGDAAVKAAVILAASTAACVTASASLMTGPAIALLVPAKHVEPGSGAIDPAAVARTSARAKVARAEATRDALGAATAAPADLRLQRRAAAMMRSCARATSRSSVVFA